MARKLPRQTKERRYTLTRREALAFDSKVEIVVRYPRGARPRVVKTTIDTASR
jgi:hypothetical protein